MSFMLFPTIRKIIAPFVLLGVATAGACGGDAAPEAYSLTDTEQDVEYLLSWETIVAQCPQVSAEPSLEGFAKKGERVELAPGEWMEVSEDSGAVWGSSRAVRDGDPNTGDFRSFNVEVSLVESDEILQQLLSTLASAGMEVQEGPVTTGLAESPLPGLPKEASQMSAVAASNRLTVYITAATGGDKAPYCALDGVDNLVQHASEQLQAVSFSAP